MMITPSVWAFYVFVFLIILRFLEVVADVCYVESWKNSGNLVIKNVVAFLRKKMIKKRFFDQKFAVIDFKVGISWRFFKISRILIDFTENVDIATVVMIQKRRIFNVFKQKVRNRTCRSQHKFMRNP